MIKLCSIFFCTLIFGFCHSQTENEFIKKQNIFKSNEVQKETQNGIVYFSYDKGNNWINVSDGLPSNVSIGLGGLTTTDNFLAIATKENGVYYYNFSKNCWQNIPTNTQIIDANIGTIAFIDSSIFVGTQFSGVFYTKDFGKNWFPLNTGLTNLTIRRFCEFYKTLYVCTNDGFYFFNKMLNRWQLEVGQNSLQTNGAAVFKNNLYIATNKGIFTKMKDKSWVNSSPQFSMHNISADKEQLNAMTYNELLLSSTDGLFWQKQQDGLQNKLYTFNVISYDGVSFAGQWDGVYRKDSNKKIWQFSSNGLPANFAVTNLKVFNYILVACTSERKFKEKRVVGK